jgi:lipopolysaccharide export system permease protein
MEKNNFLKNKTVKMTILDKYILKQVIEMFIMGVFIFTSIIFASDTFITLIKQISLYGIPFKVALMIIILNLPAVFVMTIPMGVLLATVMTLNRLSLASEITVMRSCGIGLNRIAKPIFIFALVMSIASFVINETVVPVTTKQSKDLALWALGQKNIPEGKQNFIFKELQDNGTLKRLFYVGDCKNKTLHNITVLDLSKDGTVQVLQAKDGGTSPAGWEFNRGAIYTVAKEGKILNTTFFETSVAQFGIDLSRELSQSVAKEHNFISLFKYIMDNPDKVSAKRNVYMIELFDKMALPITTVVLVLIGVPLAITPPRVRYNRGFLFSILIIFAYYLLRALSISFGETGALHPFLAAWLANIILSITGLALYYRKVYTIN